MPRDELEAFVAVHDAIRRDLQALSDTVWALDVDADNSGHRLFAWFRSFWSLVEHHHQNEEQIAFPLLRQKTAAFDASAFRAEHEALDASARHILDALQAYAVAPDRVERVVWRGALCVRITRFAERLTAHLDREDALFLPLARRHFNRDEMRAIERRTQRRTPLKVVGLHLPWVLAHAAPDEEERALSRLPLPWRLLYRWRWKKTYERLVQPLLRANAGAGVA